MSIADKLITIAENEQKIYDKGGLDASPQETVSGEAIVITDISPIEHNMAVSVRGKNLIPYPYFDKTKTVIGITYTDNGDGSITINGTAGSTSEVFYLTGSHSTADIGDLFEDGKTYKIASAGVATFVLMCKSLADGKDKYYYAGNTFTVDKSTYRYMHLRLQVTNKTVDNAIVYPMIEEGTTATSYAPYIADISKVKLYKQGKNMFKSTNYAKGTLLPATGELSGINTTKAVTTDFIYLKAGTYTIDCDAKAHFRFIFMYDESKAMTGSIWTNRENPYTFTLEKDCYIRIDMGKDDETTLTHDTFFEEYKCVLGIGTTKPKYEPYIEPTIYDVNADGTVEGVKSLYPSTTLYTDTNGAVIDATYYQDGKKVKENLIDMILSLGGVINE